MRLCRRELREEMRLGMWSKLRDRLAASRYAEPLFVAVFSLVSIGALMALLHAIERRLGEGTLILFVVACFGLVFLFRNRINF